MNLAPYYFKMHQRRGVDWLRRRQQTLGGRQFQNQAIQTQRNRWIPRRFEGWSVLTGKQRRGVVLSLTVAGSSRRWSDYTAPSPLPGVNNTTFKAIVMADSSDRCGFRTSCLLLRKPEPAVVPNNLASWGWHIPPHLVRIPSIYCRSPQSQEQTC